MSYWESERARFLGGAIGLDSEPVRLGANEAAAAFRQICTDFEKGPQTDRDVAQKDLATANLYTRMGWDARSYLGEMVTVGLGSLSKEVTRMEKIAAEVHAQVEAQRITDAVLQARQKEEQERVEALAQERHTREQRVIVEQALRAHFATRNTRVEDRAAVRAKYPAINSKGMRVALSKMRAGRADW